ncbi:MAG: hypothetical protein AAFQ98_08890 [Bacteroidota bacterium]
MPDISGIEVSVNIVRLEDQLMNQPDQTSLAVWLDANPVVRDLMWGRENYLDATSGTVDSAFFVSELYKILQDSTFRTAVYGQTQETFQDLSDIEESLSLVFRRLKAQDPSFTPPAIKTVISGFGRDVYVSDTLWLISLENFIGPGAYYRPQGPGNQPLPQYLAMRYQREYIVPILLKSFAQKYILFDNMSSPTLLDQMLRFGKLYEFTKSVLPELPDSLIVRYPQELLVDVEENMKTIWSHFIENELLYNTQYYDYRGYIDEAPGVPAIGSRCPGRIGRYVGWQILQEYRKQTDEDLLTLMKNPQSQRILQTSRFKP